MQTRKFCCVLPRLSNSTAMLICRIDNCCSFCLAHEVIMQLNGDDNHAISVSLKYLDVKYVGTKICHKCLQYLKIVSHFIENYVTLNYTFSGYLAKKNVTTSSRNVEHYASLISDCNVNFALTNTQIEVFNKSTTDPTKGEGMLPILLEKPKEALYDATKELKELCKLELSRTFCYICKTEQSLGFAQVKGIFVTNGRKFVTQHHTATTRKISIKEQDHLKKNFLKIGRGNRTAFTLCNMTFTTKNAMKAYLLSHVHSMSRSQTNDKTYHCTLCKKYFNFQSHLKTHYRSHTNEKPYSCTICKKSFSQQGSLNIHFRSHTDEKPYQCTICLKSFTSQSYLTKHHWSHSNEKPYECTLCKKSFNFYSNLKVHLRSHSNEKPYDCTICKKSFSSQSYLKTHAGSHTDEKLYQCATCKESFRYQSSLKRHYLSHTNEKPYECAICKKSFRCKANLKIHYRSHTKEKPYECTICKKSFSYKNNCNNHYRTHSNEKPYECTICRKSFSLRRYLTKHYRFHANEKPYQCTICKKSFSSQSYLTQHRCSHSNEKSYECTL